MEKKDKIENKEEKLQCIPCDENNHASSSIVGNQNFYIQYPDLAY